MEGGLIPGHPPFVVNPFVRLNVRALQQTDGVIAQARRIVQRLQGECVGLQVEKTGARLCYGPREYPATHQSGTALWPGI